MDKDLYFEILMTRIKVGYVHTIRITFKFMFDRIVKKSLQWKKFFNNMRIQRGKQMKVNFIEVNYMSHIDERYS
jgi:hypothetical protein